LTIFAILHFSTSMNEGLQKKGKLLQSFFAFPPSNKL
jgi:hypothetical protein